MPYLGTEATNLKSLIDTSIAVVVQVVAKLFLTGVGGAPWMGRAHRPSSPTLEGAHRTGTASTSCTLTVCA